MPLLSDRDRKEIQSELAALEGPVTLVAFTQVLACQYCRENEQLVKEVGELSGKISVEIYNFQLDKVPVAKYGIDKIPATVVQGARDYKIRFYGVPLGYEFVALLEAMKDASRGSTTLKPETKSKLTSLKAPVHLQVYVTPT
jgi:alkyl hydroperoxide reductase subunit AhpF